MSGLLRKADIASREILFQLTPSWSGFATVMWLPPGGRKRMRSHALAIGRGDYAEVSHLADAIREVERELYRLQREREHVAL
jgi:hypothetical protein